jgi:hypothetical protein
MQALRLKIARFFDRCKVHLKPLQAGSGRVGTDAGLHELAQLMDGQRQFRRRLPISICDDVPRCALTLAEILWLSGWRTKGKENGVICSTRPPRLAVIPAPAGISFARSRKGAAEELDSCRHGNEQQAVHFKWHHCQGKRQIDKRGDRPQEPMDKSPLLLQPRSFNRLCPRSSRTKYPKVDYRCDLHLDHML